MKKAFEHHINDTYESIKVDVLEMSKDLIQNIQKLFGTQPEIDDTKKQFLLVSTCTEEYIYENKLYLNHQKELAYSGSDLSVSTFDGNRLIVGSSFPITDTTNRICVPLIDEHQLKLLREKLNTHSEAVFVLYKKFNNDEDENSIVFEKLEDNQNFASNQTCYESLTKGIVPKTSEQIKTQFASMHKDFPTPFNRAFNYYSRYIKEINKTPFLCNVVIHDRTDYYAKFFVDRTEEILLEYGFEFMYANKPEDITKDGSDLMIMARNVWFDGYERNLIAAVKKTKNNGLIIEFEVSSKTGIVNKTYFPFKVVNNNVQSINNAMIHIRSISNKLTRDRLIISYAEMLKSVK